MCWGVQCIFIKSINMQQPTHPGQRLWQAGGDLGLVYPSMRRLYSVDYKWTPAYISVCNLFEHLNWAGECYLIFILCTCSLLGIQILFFRSSKKGFLSFFKLYSFILSSLNPSFLASPILSFLFPQLFFVSFVLK